MLFLVEMEVSIPHDVDTELLERLKREERERALALQREGRWRHLWRVAGRYANVSVFDVDTVDELHEILFGLPMFPFLDISATPLSRHPSALE